MIVDDNDPMPDFFDDYHHYSNPFMPSVDIPNFNHTTTTGNLSNDQLTQLIIENIQQIYDPEISVNVFDLGLIYKIAVDAEQNVSIDMTLTSPACPSAQEIPMVIQMAAGVIDAVKSVEVAVVWDPPWGPDKMSDEAKLELGLF